jgi:hypothetical protein
VSSECLCQDHDMLSVSAPAYFPQKVKQMQVQKGEQAHVQCTALGDTPIEIMWKVGGKRIGGDVDQRCSSFLICCIVFATSLRVGQSIVLSQETY